MDSEESNELEKTCNSGPFIGGHVEAIPDRRISSDICAKFNYRVGTLNGRPVHIAPLYNEKNQVVAQKIRFTDQKDFRVIGDISKAGLFGQNLFKAGGKKIIITEGEIDALSYAQTCEGKWPVVSIPNGVGSALGSVKKSIGYLESFESIVVFFDNDAPGQKAAREVAELFKPGTVQIAKAPVGYKDLNDLLVAGKLSEINSLVWNSAIYRPDGIVCGKDILKLLSKPLEKGYTYPWESLNKRLHGMRPREIVTLCAGSGIGKSHVASEIAYNIVINHKLKVGYIALEESVQRSALRFLGLYMHRPVHIPGFEMNQAEIQESFTRVLDDGLLYFYDSFGSIDDNNLMSKMRYLVNGCGCKFLILDHLSIVVSALDSSIDERRAIDRIMTNLRSFTEETGAGLLLVSHLKRPSGVGHEEGGAVTLAQLRGSAAIAQLSDIVIGLERDQQANSLDERNSLVFKILKNRFTGITGPACTMKFDIGSNALSGEIDGDFHPD